MSAAREEILGRIRAGLADVPHDESPDEPTPPRDYERRSPLAHSDVVARFVTRASEYTATVRHAADGDVGALAARVLREHRAQRIAVPADLPPGWRPAGVEVVVDDGLSAGELDAVDGALTGCALAIAETGSLVLDCGAAQGRRMLTLLPDLHLCVVDCAQVVGTVPEAMELLASVRRPITFVSGPSATSDIELTRVEGVHGPRRLELLLTGTD